MTTTALRDQFPGLANNWHYLDTAATAQKPQVVLDAMMRAGGADYATVHRGVYARSANMTVAFEAARERVARFCNGWLPIDMMVEDLAADIADLHARVRKHERKPEDIEVSIFWAADDVDKLKRYRDLG